MLEKLVHMSVVWLTASNQCIMCGRWNQHKRWRVALTCRCALQEEKLYLCTRLSAMEVTGRSRLPSKGARIRSRVVPGRSRPWRAGRRERIGGHGSFPPARALHACLHKLYLCARLRKLYLCTRIRKLYLCAHLSTSEVTCRSRLLARALYL